MFAEAERSKLSVFLAEIDIINLPRLDENQISVVRNEVKDALKKSNCIPKIALAFESLVKPEYVNNSIVLDEYYLNFLRWTGLSKGEAIALSFAVSYVKIKPLAIAARRVLRAKLPEISSMTVFLEMSEEIRANLIHAIQSDEELAQAGTNFIALAKEHYNASAHLSALKPGAISPSEASALGKVGDAARTRLSATSMLEEYGCQCSLSAETFRKVLLSAGPLSEEQVGGVIVLVSPKSYQTAEANAWNLEIIAEVMHAECRGLNWTLVAKFLDNPKLSIRAEGDFQTLTRLFVRISGAPLPAAGLLASVWNNRPAQFAMLMLSSSAPRAIVDFAPLITQDQLLQGENIPLPPNFSWLCLPLYMRLFELASSGLPMEVLEVIGKAASLYPEYVLTSLAAVPPEPSGIRNEMLHRLLPLFTGLPGSKPTCFVVLKRLFAVNVDLLIRLCYYGFRRCKKVAEVLHVENIAKNLSPANMRKLEEEGSAEDLLSYWCVKTDKGEFNLEEKISSLIELNPKVPRMVTTFVRQHIEGLRPRYAANAEGILSFESCAVLLRIVQQFPSIVPVDELKVLVQHYLQLQQQLQQAQPSPSFLPPASHPNAFNPIVNQIVEATEVARLNPAKETEDVEAIANAYFQKIYTGDISIPEVIALMRQFKSSAEKKEQEIFRCMVHNLFDEYRFFHKYPEKELQITGRLFGSLIQHQLVSSITLGIALRYVLEALRKDPDQGEGNEKMFRFGLIALDQFRSRLGEWPQYCSHLIQIPHLSRHNPDLFQEAQRSLNNPLPSQPTPPPMSTPSQLSTPSQMSYDYSSGGGSAFSSFANPPPSSFPPIPSQPSNLTLSSLPPQNLSLGSAPHHSSPSPFGPQGMGSMGGMGSAGVESVSLLGGGNPLPSKLMPSLPAQTVQPAAPITSLPAGLPTPVPATLLPPPVSTPALPQMESPVLSAVVTGATDIGDGDSSKEIERMQLVNKPLENPVAPPDGIRDQVQFVINNVAKNNIDVKCNELKELLTPPFFPWFASFVVEKRVSSQPNLHPLYLNLLDTLHFNELNKHIIESTYYNITKYLSSPIITTSSNERSVLRNFGMWLGQLTLARNRPLLSKRIDLKALLYWGYETGRLIAVCSFIAKVIEGVRDSKVFRPPNPWLMAILGVLKELTEIEDLKINIKFEVQSLCKNINVKIEEIPKTNLLSKCKPPVKDQNPDFNLKAIANQQPAASAAPPTMQPSPLQPPQVAPQPVQVPSAPSRVPSDSEAASMQAQPPLAQAQMSSLPPSAGASSLDISTAITINPALSYFASFPQQKRMVVAAIERGIQEIITAAVDRSATIALATAKHFIAKDLGGEKNETIVKNAVVAMASSLASSLSLAISKEPLRIAYSNHLRTLFTAQVSDANLLDQIVSVCSNDNIELGCVLIEKAATEKVMKDMEEVVSDILRKKDASLSSTPPAHLVELLALGGDLSQAQWQLYEAFQRKPSPVGVAASASNMGAAQGDSKAPISIVNMNQALEAYQVLYHRIEMNLLKILSQGRELTLSMLERENDIIPSIRDMLAVTTRMQPNVRIESSLVFTEQLFHKMFDSLSTVDILRIEVNIAILEAIREACGGSKVFRPDLIGWLNKYGMVVSNDEGTRKVYRHILLLLVRAKLVQSNEIDHYLAVHIDNGRHLFYLEVALSFIKQCLVENVGSIYDFTNTLDTITKMRPTSMLMKKQLQKWITEIRALATAQDEQRMGVNSAGNIAPSSSNATVGPAPVAPPSAPTAAPAPAPAPAAAPAAPLFKVDPAFKEQATLLLDRWLRVYTNITDQLFAQYVQLLHQCGVLKTEDTANTFFRLALEICIDAVLKSNSNNIGENAFNYTVIDALAKLFTLLIRLADKENSEGNNVRTSLLQRILTAVLRSFLEDMEVKKGSNLVQDTRPYYRLFSVLSQDLLGTPDPKSEQNLALLPLLNIYTQAYLAVQPSTAPSFAFHWLQLISKRCFMPHLLRMQKCWPNMHRLLVSLLTFMQPFLKLGQLPEPTKRLYKGLLRILLVLLHDFPEFLCDFHLSLCDLIPLHCVQLRNLILSAFPRTMRLPDPFTPNLKLDLLTEINHSPRILADYITPLSQVKNALDNYLSVQQPADFPANLAALLSPAKNPNFSMPQMSSLVIYVGSYWISQLQSNKLSLSSPSMAMELFKQLFKAFDPEGRYIFINNIANQLRYPNSHTNLFSTVLLNLFADSDEEFMQEQITRVLLERLIVHRPHPWGLLISFIDLIKNPRFAFWKKSFTRGDLEVEKVFESIARSCIGPTAASVIQQQIAQ